MNKIKDVVCLLLVCALAVSLCACGGEDGSSSAPGEQGGEQESVTEPTDDGYGSGIDGVLSYIAEEPVKLTLADGEAKLIYAKDTYVVAAFYGPDDDIGAHFCAADGSDLGYFVGYGHPSENWTLVLSEEFPEGYDYSGIGLSVTDYNAEKTADGTYPSQKYLNMEQMTEEEMKAIGLDFLDGHCCIVGGGRATYGGNQFGLTYGITWFDDYYFTSLEDMEGFSDRFSYFAGDGTPLAEYFEGYSTLEVTPLISMTDVMLIQDSSTNNKEKNKAMCDELRACKPYLIYTGLDGTVQRFDLLADN